MLTLRLAPLSALAPLLCAGVDGVITTCSTIASVAGGGLSIQVVLVLGFANLIADALSMGVGDYLSSLAEFHHLIAERKRGEALYDSTPAKSKAAVADVLVEKGLSAADAEELLSIMSRPEHKEFYLDFMMVEEMGLELPGDPWGPAKDGGMTLLSFLVFGSIPMWVYVITYGVDYHDRDGSFGIAAAATILALFLLGWVQGTITRQPRLKSAILMTVTGALACAAAYLVSWGITEAIGTGGEGCPE